jgi:hypothetical protein
MRSWWVVVVVLGACGDAAPPDVPGSTHLTDLTDNQDHDLCEYIRDVAGDSGSVPCTSTQSFAWHIFTCSSGRIVSSEAICGATVDDAETCFEQAAKKVCDASCLRLADCF